MVLSELLFFAPCFPHAGIRFNAMATGFDDSGCMVRQSIKEILMKKQCRRVQ